MSDRHRFFLEVDAGFTELSVQCPYDRNETTRPCWPHSEHGVPDPAPQDMCTYTDWIANTGAGDVLHGTQTLPLRAAVEWDGGNFELHLLPPPNANDLCVCGCTRTKHIYDEGACRPGYVCPQSCTEFRLAKVVRV